MLRTEKAMLSGAVSRFSPANLRPLREPLIELPVKKRTRIEIFDGIKFQIPLCANGSRDLAHMSDEDLVDYAQAKVDHFNLRNRTELEEVDPSLVKELRDADLFYQIEWVNAKTRKETFDGIEFDVPLRGINMRDLKAMDNVFILRYAQAKVNHFRMRSTHDMQKGEGKDKVLEEELRRRDLLKEIKWNRNDL
ncbi:hypothetical protein HYT84_00715 [Candidatus Micrarchaeota archaeon]|nr:hypothetical protein [Candidatus Micrarchaeota archaeon]